MPAVDQKRTQEARNGNASKDKNAPRRWWNAPKSEVARQLAAWTDSIERGNWSRRWANLVFYRYITGRPTAPTSFNYSATARPSSVNIYSRAQFETPRYNLLAQCSDSLGARIYADRPLLQVSPIAGNQKARVKSKQLTRWLDAIFYDMDLWHEIEKCGDDCRTWGSAFLKIDVDLLGKIKATRVLQDEIVIDENECNAGEPQHMAIRLFVNRDELAERYKGNPEALEAIRTAPHATNGLYFGSDIDYTNVVVLREAWSLKRGTIKGRYVLALNNYAFEDKEYDKEYFPLAKLVFKQVSTSWFGMGMPEMALGLQRELDRCSAAYWENIRRAAWPRILLAAGSNVNPGSLGDKSNGLVNFTGVEPKFVVQQAIGADAFRWYEDIARRMKELFRLNDQMSMGTKRREYSGRAIELSEDIDDAAHMPQAERLQDFVMCIGRLLINAGEKAKPAVRLPGRSVQVIKWEDVELDQNSFDLRVFPVGRLSKSMAERQKQIDTWFAQGKISKGTAMRLEQIPDIDGYQDLVNASRDYVEATLDKMVEDGEYAPPTGLEDLQEALEQAQSRYMLEKLMGTDQKYLDLILKYIVSVQQLSADANPPTPAVPFGMQAPAGAPGNPGPGMAPPGGLPMPNVALPPGT